MGLGISLTEKWLIVAEDSSDEPHHAGRVLAYTVCDTEEDARCWEGRRGELCDKFGLYMDCDIPDDFGVEIMTEAEFYECYRNRMPLRNYVDFNK